MNIPPINISVTKAAVDGHVVDVVDYEEYRKNYESYKNRNDVSVPVDFKGREILLPVKGDYNGESVTPGIYNAGCIDFIKYPEEDFVERYTAKNSITMNNSDDIRDLIIAGEAAKKLDEPFITMPDNVTNIPIRETDHPEMVALKLALNAKHIDIDKYAGRFGDNYPNDKRQLKSSSATVKIIKRFCKNCDMEAILTFKDKSPDVPNPMNKEISVSLTEPFDDELSAAIFGNNNYIQSESSEFEEDDDE